MTEGTLISERHAGRRNVPGIWSKAQIQAWKEIVEAVHAEGCRIWCQLWALGRGGMPETLESVGSRLMSSSAVPLKDDGKSVPIEMSEEDIRNTIQEYAQAARNALEAGFDGVELHGYTFEHAPRRRRTDADDYPAQMATYLTNSCKIPATSVPTDGEAVSKIAAGSISR